MPLNNFIILRLGIKLLLKVIESNSQINSHDRKWFEVYEEAQIKMVLEYSFYFLFFFKKKGCTTLK